jgi:hypothetical protein
LERRALDRLLDEAHASLVEAVVRVLETGRWEVITEATFAIAGERGSVDILGWHAVTRSLLVVEVKSVLADAQDTLSKLARKVRLAQQIAPTGWSARSVSPLLVIAETRTNRRHVETLDATFENAFPQRAIEIRRFIRTPPSDHPIRGLWFLSSSTQTTARHRIRRSRQDS